jgi:hypothetical protein
MSENNDFSIYYLLNGFSMVRDNFSSLQMRVEGQA